MEDWVFQHSSTPSLQDSRCGEIGLLQLPSVATLSNSTGDRPGKHQPGRQDSSG